MRARVGGGERENMGVREHIGKKRLVQGDFFFIKRALYSNKRALHSV